MSLPKKLIASTDAGVFKTGNTDDWASSLEAERCVISSAVLASPDAVLETARKLDGSKFKIPAHGVLWAILCDFVKSGGPIEFEFVFPVFVERSGLGADEAFELLKDVLDCVPNAAHIDYYAGSVLREWQQGQFRHAVAEFQSETATATGDFTEAAAKFRAAVDALDTGSDEQSLSYSHVLEVELRAAQAPEDSGPVFTTGIQPLDEAIKGGFGTGQLVLIAARPGVGKTVFGAQIVSRAANRGTAAVYLSYEMTEAEMSSRFKQVGNVRADDVTDINRYCELPLWLPESASWDINKIEQQVKRFVKEHELKIVAIDYVQLIPKESHKIDTISHLRDVTRRLKLLSLSLGICVLGLSQFNRAGAGRENHKPTLFDLRGSGSLEEDADLVMAIHREDDPAKQNEGEVMILKNRRGPLANVPVVFVPERMMFAERAVGEWGE